MEEYALIIEGHPFEYEVQATTKLFVPGVRFKIFNTLEASGMSANFIYTGIEMKENPVLCVKTQIKGNSATASYICQTDSEKNDMEFCLCRLLFDTLQTLTGYTPPWGLLTGIRPVRKVLQELDKGKSLEETYKYLQKKYLISDEKLSLACDTAMIQKPILPHDEREIGLYISIPFCPTRCSYCSFVSHSMDTAWQLIPEYVEKLCEELEVLGRMIREYGLSVHSVYIGGGTPTSVSAEQLQKIMQTVADNINLSNAREYTVEAGRADTITRDKLLVIRNMGATRISVNPQTLQDSVLEAIGRRHTAQQAVDAFHLAREIGFDDINMDLIAGLPTDTMEGFCDTLHRVMALEPDSITVHTLTLKRSADLYGTDQTKQTALVAEMAEYSAKQLPAHGYRPYYLYRQKNTLGNLENVGYARKGKENLYNILIMDETQTILGAGCAASTKLVEQNGEITRVMNYKFPFEYISRFETMMEKKKTIADILKRIQEARNAKEK